MPGSLPSRKGVAVCPIMSTKPGATTFPVASIVSFALRMIQLADLKDLAIGDGDVGDEPGRSGAIDEFAILHEQIHRFCRSEPT